MRSPINVAHRKLKSMHQMIEIFGLACGDQPFTRAVRKVIFVGLRAEVFVRVIEGLIALALPAYRRDSTSLTDLSRNNGGFSRIL
jgi:hypothetical protein